MLQFSLHEKLLQEYPTLANKSLKHYFYFVNRLDYSTSGLLCIALNKKACTEASACFEKRSVVKYYLAIVRGHLSVNRMNISLSIGKYVLLGRVICIALLKFLRFIRKYLQKLCYSRNGKTSLEIFLHYSFVPWE